MKFIITDENHPFKREIELIFKLFQKSEDELIFGNEQEGIIVDLNSSIEDGKVKAYAFIKTGTDYFSYNKEKSLGETDKTNRIKSKQALAFVWLKALEHMYEEKQSWGILTGIRPTKLYHKLIKTNSYENAAHILSEEYLLASSKIKLLEDIAKRQLKVIPDLNKIDKEVSIYIGIPFCPTKCAYCTFPAYAINGQGATVNKFLEALDFEINELGKWLNKNNIKVTTIYFGGGTPTSIEAVQLDNIFKSLNNWLSLKEVREITVEAGRPDTITDEKLNVLNKWNVNRISINPQTFTDDTLNIIGRHHTVSETIEKYLLAKKHTIPSINMDLIIGLPGETLNDLQNSLKNIQELVPESLTVHTMAFKKTSYLTKHKDEFEITNEKEVKKMMEYAKEWTKEQNYNPYYLYRQKNMLGNLENIGYAKDGHESLYNIIIMEEKQTIIGLGSGAVSKLVVPNSEELTRMPNPKDPKTYIDNIKANTIKKIKQLNEIFFN